LPLLQTVKNEFYAARDAQFFEDSKQVVPHRVLAKLQLIRDFLVGHALRHEARDVGFALGKQVDASGVLKSNRRNLAQRFQEIPRCRLLAHTCPWLTA